MFVEMLHGRCCCSSHWVARPLWHVQRSPGAVGRCCLPAFVFDSRPNRTENVYMLDRRRESHCMLVDALPGQDEGAWQQAASTFLSTTLKWNAERASVYAEFL